MRDRNHFRGEQRPRRDRDVRRPLSEAGPGQQRYQPGQMRLRGRVSVEPGQHAKQSGFGSAHDFSETAQPGKHERDAYHMVEAAKYGGYFITRDARLLKKRLEVARLLGAGFAIVTPPEFLEAYKRFNGQR